MVIVRQESSNVKEGEDEDGVGDSEGEYRRRSLMEESVMKNWIVKAFTTPTCHYWFYASQ
jgi:hypothetical protein